MKPTIEVEMAPYEKQHPTSREVRCPFCMGTGIPPLYPLSEYSDCWWCNGTGTLLSPIE